MYNKSSYLWFSIRYNIFMQHENEIYPPIFILVHAVDDLYDMS